MGVHCLGNVFYCFFIQFVSVKYSIQQNLDNSNLPLSSNFLLCERLQYSLPWANSSELETEVNSTDKGIDCVVVVVLVLVVVVVVVVVVVE